MSQTETLARNADEYFRRGVGLAFDDAEQRLLRYHLLRLTVVGLKREERGPLCELARLAFEGAGITDQVTAIRERPDGSPLASTIATIVERAGQGQVRLAGRADVLIGAVLGAYAGPGGVAGLDEADVAIVGAIGGNSRLGQPLYPEADCRSRHGRIPTDAGRVAVAAMGLPPEPPHEY
jgi:hypothetical protein